MFITTTLIAALAFAQSEAPVTLARTYTKGEKLTYEYKGTLHEESREYGLLTWLPNDVDISYRFTVDVQEIKNDGFAKVLYKRPTMTIVDGETTTRGPKTTVEKLNMILQMTVSPYNEITDLKDLSPKKPEKEKPKKDPDEEEQTRMLSSKPAAQISTSIVESATSGMTRLMLFLGSMESSLDFAPRLPFDELKVGDTWKRTVGYSPQKLAGKEGKMASQRLDFTYTYKGLVKSGNTEVHRITAELALDTNLADFINQSMGMTSKESGLKSLPFKLKAQIAFDLDKKNFRTIKAVASGESTSQIFITELQDALDESKMTSQATLRFIPQPAPTPAKTTKASTRKPRKK